ncbi:hypothetical protein [Aeromonas caviae]|uniref:hypothetical protein n=1 Tax=Aeromonas caviae TaxID=648 RepID=UPI00313D2DEE
MALEAKQNIYADKKVIQKMAKIQNPLLFSKHFGVDEKELEKAGLIDPFLNVDTQLFIDPVLLEKSDHPKISVNAYKNFRDHFSNYVRLLAISKTEGDAAWKGARKLLDLREPAHTGLGYGGSSRSGSSRPEDVREVMMKTAKEIIDLGTNDPEMVSLMGFFEENVGPDTISDFTTRVIIESLAEITNEFCTSHGIPIVKSDLPSGCALPVFEEAPMILVPRDIVRDLPIANDWSDIEAAALQNQLIRDRVNQYLAHLIKPTIKERKAALRYAALGSPVAFEHFLGSVKEHSDSYDPNEDALAYYKVREILRSDLSSFRQTSVPDIHKGPEELKTLVITTIEQFKHHVEKGNLWEELWIGSKPKKERAAQLIYFAMTDCFCKANNVDVSPEANMGGGPIDFKFSDGYNARVLVEMKRSSGTVKHGYEKQLEIYKDASRTNFGIFVVMDFGDLGGKLAQIQMIRNERLDKGEQASEIIVIDATKKLSASKRT